MVFREELSTITLNCHIVKKNPGDILYLWPFECVFAIIFEQVYVVVYANTSKV